MNIPTPDLLPIPAPAWLLQVLLVGTFLLHLIFMNCLFGGSIISVISTVKSKADKNFGQLAKTLFSSMPIVLSLTVTFGIAPLLFLQTLYGQFFYSSSVLMAGFWFLVFPLIIIAYYTLYYIKFKWDKLTDMRFTLSLIATGIFVVVGFIYVNNITLSMRPEAWANHYFSSGSFGKLNLTDAQLYPRYLHFLLGALAVSGIWIMLIGARGKSGDSEWSQWAISYGSRVFLYPTFANIAVGFWFLAALPRSGMMIFMGQNMLATALLGFSFLLTLSTIFIVAKAGKSEDGKKLTYVGLGHVIAILLMMVIMREQVRVAILKPYFSISDLSSDPQWGLLALFLAIFVIGIGTVIWMLKAAAIPAPKGKNK